MTHDAGNDRHEHSSRPRWQAHDREPGSCLAVPLRRRLALSLLCGLVAGGVTVQSNVTKAFPRDFGQVWFAARSILHGVNPYPLVGPGLAYDWPWPLLYPLPAAVAAVPFAPLPLAAASTVFSVSIGMAFAYALMEFGYAPLFGFFSGALHLAAETAHWSPLFGAAVIIPWLSFFLVVKPTIGFAVFCARPSWWAPVGAISLSAIAWMVQPTWVTDWLAAVARNDLQWWPDVPYRAPILFPGGAFALLALLRWRRPEARLVAVLACVPQTTTPYEALPLFLVPRTFVEAAIMNAASYAQFFLGRYLVDSVPTEHQHLMLSGRWLVVLYVPATIMVLRRRNEGAMPAWIEARVAGCPMWLRGRSARR